MFSVQEVLDCLTFLQLQWQLGNPYVGPMILCVIGILFSVLGVLWWAISPTARQKLNQVVDLFGGCPEEFK